MKKTCAILSLNLVTAFTSSTYGKSADPVATLEELAAEISFSDVEYIHLKVTRHDEEILDLLKATSKCDQKQNFKSTTASKITQLIRAAFDEAYSLMLEQEVIDQDDGYFSRRETLEAALVDFKKIESHAKLKLCIEDSVPAYSDGHRLIAILKNGAPFFTFEVGRPD